MESLIVRAGRGLRFPRSRRLRGGLLAGALVLWVALASEGCGLFKPASPQPPIGSALAPTFAPEPENTLETLRLAIEDKSSTNGQAIYTQAFADSSTEGRDFHAFFDARTVDLFTNSNGREPDLNWGRGYEQSFYARLVTLKPGAYQFSWQTDAASPTDDRNSIPGIELLHEKYQAVATGSDATQDTLALGFADLYFARLNGSWKIVRWQDREDLDANPNLIHLTMGLRRLESQ